MNNLPREQLKYIIVQYGRSLSEDPQRCEALLRDLCGQYRKEINVLVSAVKEGVPADLSNSQNTVPSDLLLSRLTKRLEDRLGLTQESAKWAVESWALALGVVSERDKKVTEPSSSPSQNSVLPPINKRVKTPSIPIDRRNFFKWLGFGGVGVVSVLAIGQIAKNSPPQNQESVSQNKKSVSPKLSNSVAPKLPKADTTTPPNTSPKLTKIQFTSVELNDKGEIINKPSASAEIFSQSLSNSVELTMVKIPAGKFLMGSPASEKGRSGSESPQHLVNVPEFYLGQTLVTQSQWTAIMGNNPSSFKGNNKLPVEKVRNKLPVEMVSWLAAMDFCQKLSQKTGRTYRLPSEAEWEYACRAGTNTPFAFGETITLDVVNFNIDYGLEEIVERRYIQKTTPVGTFPPNLFGLYDMHGNLWEWCLDEWGNNYDGAPTDGSARGDINSRDEDKMRVWRGGSWDTSNASSCRSASRSLTEASHRDYLLGFRVVSVPSMTS